MLPFSCSADFNKLWEAASDSKLMTLPTQLQVGQRFAQAGDALLHLVVRNTTLQPTGSYGNMAMHRAPPSNAQPRRVFNVGSGQVVYIPRGWWHWVLSDANTASVTLWGQHPFDEVAPMMFLQCAERRRCKPRSLRHWHVHADDGPKNMDISLLKYKEVSEAVLDYDYVPEEASCSDYCEQNTCAELNGDVAMECGSCGEGYACRGTLGVRSGLGAGAEKRMLDEDCGKEHLDQLADCVGAPLAGDINYWETRDTPHTTPLHYDESDSTTLGDSNLHASPSILRQCPVRARRSALGP